MRSGADRRGRMGPQGGLGLTDGYRESTQSWRELLLDLKRRGLTRPGSWPSATAPSGFWAALREVFGTTREQRCWVHKTGNVLNAMPKSVQPKAKGHLHDIWQAETKADAEAAFDFFVETYGVKYDKAVAKLVKDREELLAFYDFPAEHWKHIRTSNPIESTFATVRHRTGKAKGCLSRKTGLAMAFRLMMSAQAKWRKLDGANRLPEIIEGLSSRTASSNFKPPPDHAVTNFCAYLRYVQLRAFHYVATEGGFSRAAEALRLTQPAISDQVRRLELEYDVLLFHRHKRRVDITEDGRRLLEITNRLFEVEAQAHDFLSESRALRSGRLRIIVDSAIHLTEILTAFRAKYPTVQISLRSGNSEEVIRALYEYNAELGVLGIMPEARELTVIGFGATPIEAFTGL
jgi:hypothetical protein